MLYEKLTDGEWTVASKDAQGTVRITYPNGAQVTMYDNNKGDEAEPSPPPIRNIHKSDFVKRMLPWWGDVRATRAADDTVDGYFEMFNHYTHVDLDWDQTIAMMNDMEARVLAVKPESTFTAAAILVDGTEEERYDA